ncbi:MULTISPECIES: AIR synthase family protein [Clostridium]|uniref:Hydrogenase expression/formation protein HypE n=3 Tax=Clostridium TaxID=1485 RepID=D8GTB4_CLOLD|nr:MULTISPECIES: AIR synthase family protein [Clostridium]ADK16713.1 predicted hydrogenase maturation factor [Clostridium ljungdahlii DSM 13528]AGY75771.1 AIR synthase family protein [Clostridium autoethanogenum DSM 10061]ALU35936.1 AIR synthase related protein domain protein [Clostridium autoethanogenum DSM 10061]OAA89411.1 Hydrogenase expression/formation protein HypE [Clostridium ljungdahlii DSM 13528]OVY52006.1 Hydrogenase expression/formation protein HypE [Clostridium autoethanogenum]
MKAGKLNWEDLKTIIDENRKVVREDVRIRSGIGEDCSVVNFGDMECVMSTDPITGASVNSGKLAVHINCNDIASCGVEPVGILVTILAPESSSLEDIRRIMEEISEETEKLNVEILGGHTEITRAVNKMVISCTVIGKGKSGEAVATSGAKEGDDILVTKHLCLEGTSIVVNDYEDKLKNILTTEEIKEAKGYIKYISVVKEGILSAKSGVNSMHDITEGGVLGALWEVAKASKVGFKVYKNKMPITKITEKICNKYAVDPLRFISSGSMLITTKDGNKLVKLLKSQNINAYIIGKITREKGILVCDEFEKEVVPPKRDELFVLEEKLK